MDRSSRFRFGALSVELMVVVLGVLIALAADSYSENRGERNRERAYLEAVISDMATSREAIASARQVTIDRSAGFGALVGWLQGGSLPDDFEVPRPQPLPEVSVPIGMLDALVSTGDINLIQDDGLRTTIIREHGALRDSQSRLARYHESAIASTREWLSALAAHRIEGVTPNSPTFPEAVIRTADLAGPIIAFGASLAVYQRLQSEMLESVEAIHDAAVAARGPVK